MASYKQGFDAGYNLAIEHAERAAVRVGDEQRVEDNWHPDRASVADEIRDRITRLKHQ